MTKLNFLTSKLKIGLVIRYILFAGYRRSNNLSILFGTKFRIKMNDMSDISAPKGADAELQDFLMAEKQKAQFHAQIHEFNDFCWDKCVDKPGSKLDSRTETCISNCVERFIDVSLLITNRFAQMLEKGGGMH